MKKVFISFCLLLMAYVGYAQETAVTPNYDHIDSLEKAVALAEKGELTKIHMMPLQFGGPDSAENTLYVPAFVEKLKTKFDTKVEHLLQEGKRLSFEATPEYKGNSFVPSKLVLAITGDMELTETIAIW